LDNVFYPEFLAAFLQFIGGMAHIPARKATHQQRRKSNALCRTRAAAKIRSFCRPNGMMLQTPA
jgi:hypothetical protein